MNKPARVVTTCAFPSVPGIQVNTGLRKDLLMRNRYIALVCLLFTSVLMTAQNSTGNCCTLTIVVEGMDSAAGNLGVLVFNNGKGWPEDRTLALKDISVPAVQGTQTLKIPNLPPGNYAVALIHDVNQNHKLDRNWIGQPKEQWGMSNNPHAIIKAPPIGKAMFELKANKEIQIQLQK
jgi:uncharacterized protein (DUF2141 family)